MSRKLGEASAPAGCAYLPTTSRAAGKGGSVGLPLVGHEPCNNNMQPTGLELPHKTTQTGDNGVA